ncbi:hypothetical protein ZIOFF_028162 [Zingiber officinale]|uniref:Uncharacterized protein n=1 Tax=Zingiber officinale TaxID=94328 RepID=A0A8J5GMP2_ZINOF|nr:hypothetical protein ZIOFF_028162 [Zingiber officinale]
MSKACGLSSSSSNASRPISRLRRCVQAHAMHTNALWWCSGGGGDGSSRCSDDGKRCPDCVGFSITSGGPDAFHSSVKSVWSVSSRLTEYLLTLIVAGTVNLAYSFWFEGNPRATLQYLTCATVIFRCDTVLLFGPIGIELLLRCLLDNTQGGTGGMGRRGLRRPILLCLYRHRRLTLRIECYRRSLSCWNNTLKLLAESGGDALLWWEGAELSIDMNTLSWDEFREVFYVKYFIAYMKRPPPMQTTTGEKNHSDRHKGLRSSNFTSMPPLTLKKNPYGVPVYINRKKDGWRWLYIILFGSLLISLGCSFMMFLASYNNYPGAYALKALHQSDPDATPKPTTEEVTHDCEIVLEEGALVVVLQLLDGEDRAATTEETRDGASMLKEAASVVRRRRRWLFFYCSMGKRGAMPSGATGGQVP